MSDQGFPKRLRLLRPAEFDRVYRAKAFAADAMLILNGCANDLPHVRLGLSLSRKVGNAVVRNRWKRLIREAFRLHRGELPTGVDIVVRPQKGAEPEFAAICASLPAVARRIARKISQAAKERRP